MDTAPTEVRAGVSLLERAVGYALGVLPLVGEDTLARPTPCADWDLRLLLVHLLDSLDALCEAVEGQVSLDLPAARLSDAGAEQLTSAVRERCRQLVGAWSGAGRGHGTVEVDGMLLSSAIVTGTGAIEIAVHGWDLARACGAARPLPAGLAEELLELAPYFVHPTDRPGRFGAALPCEADAQAGERLLRFLGRTG
ncbi:TIGR03086 family metal-binding protein [Streptomyces polyrhachis]|uniref:TIGR03086 family metal-binding protein n=1 Tax=Streptomyces polyrhachis TaxID=1282885 RepID=A0ABW2GI88_9ACTN